MLQTICVLLYCWNLISFAILLILFPRPLAFSLFFVCGINDDNFLSDTDKDEGKKVMQFIVIQSIQSSCCAQNALLFSLSLHTEYSGGIVVCSWR